MVAWRSAAVLAGAGALLAATGQEPTSLDELLRRAGAYLVDYTRQVTAVVAEERYEQVAIMSPPLTMRKRLLRSDVLVIANEEVGWVGFRDVFEVDGSAVRDRDDRLARLILKPAADTLRQARRIADESARYNVTFEERDLHRTSNMPLTPLRFLWPQNQSRSTFKIDRAASVDGVRTVIVEFRETGLPRIISTADRAPAHGRFWIEPNSGRIFRTELSFTTQNVTTKFIVTYAPEHKIGLQVPVSMDEDYRVGQGDYLTITGHATYSNFRKFSVDTSVIVKAP